MSPILRPKALIGMVHVGALPGTPRASAPVSQVIQQAEQEARIYRDYGADAIIIENMHDLPYLNRQVGPEIVAAMTLLGQAVKAASGLPVGVQILAGANQAALAVALAAGLDFIRAEGFVFGHVADEGWLDADAGPLLRYRRQIGAEHIRIVADIKKKHSAHAVTADVSLPETAQAAEFCGADGVIVTGSSTGMAADAAAVQDVAAATALPLWIGSGITADNLSEYAPHAHAFIVGSWIKEGGQWQNPPDPKRVAQLAAALAAFR